MLVCEEVGDIVDSQVRQFEGFSLSCGFKEVWVPSYIPRVCYCDGAYYCMRFGMYSFPYGLCVFATVFRFRYGRRVVPVFCRENVLSARRCDYTTRGVRSAMFI